MATYEEELLQARRPARLDPRRLGIPGAAGRMPGGPIPDLTGQDPTGAPLRAVERGLARGAILAGPDQTDAETARLEAAARTAPAVAAGFPTSAGAGASQRDVRLAEPAPVDAPTVSDSEASAGSFGIRGPVSGRGTSVESAARGLPEGVQEVNRMNMRGGGNAPASGGTPAAESPILAMAARMDASKAADAAAQRDEMINSMLRQSMSAGSVIGGSGKMTVGQNRDLARMGNLAARVLAADQYGKNLAHTEAARLGAKANMYGSELQLAGAKEQAGAARYGAEKRLEGDKYGADVGLEGTKYNSQAQLTAAIAKARAELEKSEGQNKATVEAARARAGGPKVTPIPGSLEGDVAITTPDGGVRFTNKAAEARAAANAKAQQIREAVMNKTMDPAVAKAQLKALGF